MKAVLSAGTLRLEYCKRTAGYSPESNQTMRLEGILTDSGCTDCWKQKKLASISSAHSKTHEVYKCKGTCSPLAVVHSYIVSAPVVELHMTPDQLDTSVEACQYS